MARDLEEIWSLGHKPFEGYGNPEVRLVYNILSEPSIVYV